MLKKTLMTLSMLAAVGLAAPSFAAPHEKAGPMGGESHEMKSDAAHEDAGDAKGESFENKHKGEKEHQDKHKGEEAHGKHKH